MDFEATPKPDPPPQAVMASSKAPNTAIEGPKRAGRLRSKVACRECRRRKVRCDVYQRGAPCTNCQLDQGDCTIIRNRRGRKPREHETTPDAPEITGSLLSGSSGDASNHSCTGRQSPIRILDQNIIHGYLDRLYAQAVSESSSKAASLLPDLLSYIQCDLSHISNEDISFLRQKGCFTFPTKDILDDLLKCYFDYVHPHVPFLDEQEFWERYLDRDPRSQNFHHTDGYRISLILFQAVLFAATICAPLNVLRRAGYTSRRAARRAAFDKVHALYSLDAERDKMVLLQTLLLMSFWRGGSSEDKDGWHWSGLAFSLAFDFCLHRQPDAHLTARQETLRKRCWWSCVLRDRLLALSEQRAPRLQLDQSDVPLLTLADYNVGRATHTCFRTVCLTQGILLSSPPTTT
ncbi:fungal-specific transcription factor domain-containing protein [Triangularia setosa]|uniref:Fungal-specific transcription factor domain-containing protein n=1 Tax=Triangularia setosa TaxID=2587417 RepID=A0AAN7A4J1_9PEZI|nr:fungal-specific transcription factor domain-containing protein [Podospora setosa]